MKNLFLYGFIATFTLITSCSSNDSEIIQEDLNLSVSSALTNEEITDLIFLREEEKLARDVYLYSYELYGNPIFKNISNSEQTHMDTVLALLNKYNINDPASNVKGEFYNNELQEIYEHLIQQSSISEVEALKVGNIIEDLDIKDLQLNEERTIKTDLLTAYGALKCGSRNHLRNYYEQLIKKNVVYSPMYISESEFEEIVSTSNEKCTNN
ncbi:DUF2202 domain-containing protein [Lutibacter holmesii]|uniref:DUF2202 domain-containing protein n=1 Tax=Lutibacter holmesii TaxID=1137985 RepID=A0ABW3WP52_9FLAO